MSYRKTAIILDRQQLAERLPETKREQSFIDDYTSFDALVSLNNLTPEESLAKILAFRFDLKLESVFVGTPNGKRSQIPINDYNIFSYVQSPEFTGYFMNSRMQVAGLEGTTEIDVRIDCVTNKITTIIKGAGSMDSTSDPELPTIETMIVDWNVPTDAANRTTPIIGATMPGEQPQTEGDAVDEPAADAGGEEAPQ